MDTPDKNRIPAASFCNFEDSPVFQYINDLSPIEPVKGARRDNIMHSLDLTSPSYLFSSPQMNPYRDSRFSMKRHRSQDLSSPVLFLCDSVKNSPDAREAIKISCRPGQFENVSETKPFKDQISLAIDLANSLKNGRDLCDIRMVPCDEVSMDAENEIGVIGSIKQSDELCGQPNDPPEFDAYSDGVLQTEDMESEAGSGLAGIQNSEQQDPKVADPRFTSFASEPQHFSLCPNNSGNVKDPRGSCNAQVGARDPDISLSNSSYVPAILSTVKAEDKEETGFQPIRKQRSLRRRCLTFDVGGSYKRIPLRDSTNDLPLDFTPLSNVPSPQKCLDSSKQDDIEILPVPQTIGLHLNGLVNLSTLNAGNKLIFKDGRVFSHGTTTFPHNVEHEFSTPVSTERDFVSCVNNIMEKAPERSMEGECFDKGVPTENRQLSQGPESADGLEQLGSCKRCRCKKSKCLKLYCDCFAAGLYCVEPCSCQDCFNKPIHEDIVMKTRQQIETRNPLAFAPKVILNSDYAIDIGDENSKTPASARHMRGCNCKKSGCLKKYCECYLMGVGCSSSCRCLGCKNIFGHKIESDAITINHEAKDNDDIGIASSQNEETSNDLERRNHVLLPSSTTFPSLAVL